MRWIIRALVALVTLAVIAVIAVLLIPAERIADVAARQFEAMTGREMTISGDVSPSLWPELGVTTGPVTLANAPWSEGGPMFAAEALSIGVDLQGLLGGAVRIRRLDATAPRVLLERAADGRANWEFETATTDADGAGGNAQEAAAPDGPASALIVTLDQAEIRNAAVSYLDRQTGQRMELDGLDAVIRMPEATGPTDVTVSARVNGQPLRGTARLGSLRGLLEGEVVDLAADVDAAGSAAEFDGRVGLAPAAEGRVSADLSDLPRLFQLAGMPAPGLPDGVGERIAVTGDLTFTGDTLNLRNTDLTVDGNAARVSADLTLAERPALTARISGGALDFSALAGGDTGAEGGGGGWPRDTLDASGLQALDADILVAAESLDLGIVRVAPFETMTALNDGRAVTELRRFGAFGGSVAGTVVLNSRGGLSTRATLTGSGIAMQPLLTQFAGFDRLKTTGDIRVNLLGVGNSVDALMKSLDGDGSIDFGAGEFVGFDLVGMIRNLDPSYVGPGTRTIFDSIRGSFTVAGGVARNRDLRVQSPLFTADGQGRVNIGAQSLNYRITPKLFEGQDILIPVRVTGPWSDLAFSLDLERAAEQRAQEEIDRLRSEAEDRVREKVGEELGVDIEPGQSIEDTLRRGVEEGLRDGLGSLLGGGN